MTEDNVHRVWTNDELDEALASLRAEELIDRQPLVEARNTLLNAVRSLEGKDTPMTRTITSVEPAEKLVPRSGRGWWIAAAAAAAVVAVGATVVATDTTGGTPQAQVATPAVKLASVQQVLNTAADKIHVTGETPVPGGKFRYVASRGWFLVSGGPSAGYSPFAYLDERLTQTWQPSDIDAEWLMKTARTGHTKWLVGDEHTFKANGKATGGDENAAALTGEWRAAGGKFSERAMASDNRLSGDWSSPTKAQLADWPRDPQKLYDLMAAEPFVAAKLNAPGVLIIAMSLLKSGVAPVDLKEAVYRAVAKIPGLTVTDQAANLDGRTGVALGADAADGSHRQELIVYPATGDFIGQRSTQLKTEGETKAGTVTGYTSVHTAIADQQGIVPPGN